MLDQGAYANGNGKTLSTTRTFALKVEVHRLSPTLRPLYEEMVAYKAEYERARRLFEMALYGS